MEKVEIHIDGWPRPDWTVYQEALRLPSELRCQQRHCLEELAGSWISVALGPVDEAVDAAALLQAVAASVRCALSLRRMGRSGQRSDCPGLVGLRTSRWDCHPKRGNSVLRQALQSRTDASELAAPGDWTPRPEGMGQTRAVYQCRVGSC